MLISFKELYTLIKNAGSAAIVYGGSLDSAIAASLLMRILSREGIMVFTAPFYKAEPTERIPTITIGLRVRRSALKSSMNIFELEDAVDVKREELGLEIRRPVCPALVKALEELWVVTRELKLLALTAAFSVLTQGSVYDADPSEELGDFVKALAEEGVVEVVETLRLFGYPQRELAEALCTTLDPYIPGVYGNRRASAEVLEKVGISPGAVMSEEQRAKLVQVLREYMARGYRREPPDVIGKKLVVRGGVLQGDIYEYFYSMLVLADLSGLELVASIATATEFAEVVPLYLREVSSRVASFIEGVVRGEYIPRRYSSRTKRITVFRADELIPVSVVSRVLRFMGFVDGVMVLEVPGLGYAVSAESLDPSWPSRIYEEGAEVRGGVAVFKELEAVVRNVRE